MNLRKFIWFFEILVLSICQGLAQDSVSIKGQLSAWGLFNPDLTLPLWSGGRFIPQVNYKVILPKDRLIDFEASANIFGIGGLNFNDSSHFDGDFKPYRFWARFSTQQFEFRAGLQKINFGSASILRPMMWFDRMDARDPLQLTDGVWAALARYYFLNNANIWLWTLYGNKDLKGWENIKTNQDVPEFGGRFQTPVPKGEAAITYHYRTADSRNLHDSVFQFAQVPENRIGLDAKFDLVVGCWIEATWVNKRKDLGMNTNQEILNLGIDYTFGVGNGLAVIFEQLVAAYDNKAFAFDQATTFSLLSMTYPVGLFDNLGVLMYYDWKNEKIYHFVNWQKQFNKISLCLMGYYNPKDYKLPTQGMIENLYAGYGVQFMFVYNY